MAKKFLYLFLALALPGLIFVFLKMFGKNEFNIDIYFQNGIKPDSICNMRVEGTYSVPDSVFKKLRLNSAAQAKLIIVFPFVKDDLSEAERVVEKYKSEDIEAVIISGIPNNPSSKLQKIFLNYEEFGPVVYCLLKIEEPWSVVLIDDKNRIRGFYDGSRRDEMDRLDTELSILLKKY